MPAQARLGDKSEVQADGHGCPGCPHHALGPALVGSTDVNVNKLPALRQDDMGAHAACCNGNTWKATKGSTTVFINGKPAMRKGDLTTHCNVSPGKLIDGSNNVMTGG